VTEFLQYEFMRNAILAGILASVVCGIIGPFVVVNRIVFISGGISHAAFGGIGLGYLLKINPIWGAVFFSLASALSIGGISRWTNLRQDTAIGILWAIGMALGVIFISLSPGYAPDLFSYLFGNILTVPFSDILLMLALCSIIILVVSLLYKEFLAFSFDEEFAMVAGVPVGVLYLLLLCLIALTVVVLIRIVGIILVIALLTIPAAISARFTHNLKKMMMLSILLGIVFTFCGLWLSAMLNLASGATIILVSGVSFLASLLLKPQSGISIERNTSIE
jgi:zinc transport system permease protein